MTLKLLCSKNRNLDLKITSVGDLEVEPVGNISYKIRMVVISHYVLDVLSDALAV